MSEKLSSVSDLITRLVSEHTVTLFTLSYCKICEKAKSFLKTENITFYNIDVDEHVSSKMILRELTRKTGKKSAPYIFINIEFIGNFASILTLYHNGTLMNVIENKPISKYDFDLIVVGGGCGGLAAAKEAGHLGKKVALFDFVQQTSRGQSWNGLGGTCTNTGCIPKKLMYHASLIGDFCEDGKYFGWNFEFNKVQDHSWTDMVNNIQTYIKKLNYEFKKHCASSKVRFFNAYVTRFKNEHTIEAQDKSNRLALFTAQTFILAIGGRPKIPFFPGAEHCITSDEVFFLPTKPGKTLIIGAGFVGLECAGFLNGLGIDVTVLVKNSVLSKYDTQISTMIASHLESLGIKFLQVEDEIEVVEQVGLSDPTLTDHMKYRIRTNSQMNMKLSGSNACFDTILLATGRQYSAKDMALTDLGVELNPVNGKILVNEYDRTGCSTIFAIGDITDHHPELAPLAVKAGKLLVKRIVSGAEEIVNYDFIPIALFTPLEYGFCGYSEDKASEVFGSAHIEIYQNRYHPLEWALQQRNSNRCYVKLICLKIDQKVIGLHILGPNAAEITQGFAFAMKLNGKKSDFDNFLGIHHTCAEVFTKLESSRMSHGKELVPMGSVSAMLI